MQNDEPPTSPFSFKAAAQKPTKPFPPKDFAADAIAAAHEQAASRPRRARKPRVEAEPGEKKTRKRRARASSDVLVLKACLRQLRTLDPKDALRLIEMLRVLFK